MSWRRMRSGLIRPAAAAPVFSYTFIQSSLFSGGGTAHNHTSISFGDAPGAGETRHILVAAGTLVANFSAVSIGGVSATPIVTADRAAGDNTIVAFYLAEVPTGTSGTVALTLSASFLFSTLGVWRLMNIGSTTPHDTATDITPSSGVLNLDCDVQAGGAIFAATQQSNGGTNTWSGVTEDYDADALSNENYSGASASFVSAQTPQAITATSADTTPQEMVGAACSFL